MITLKGHATSNMKNGTPTAHQNDVSSDERGSGDFVALANGMPLDVQSKSENPDATTNRGEWKNSWGFDKEDHTQNFVEGSEPDILSDGHQKCPRQSEESNGTDKSLGDQDNGEGDDNGKDQESEDSESGEGTDESDETDASEISEDDDEEEDEEPPILQYSRVTKLPKTFFTRDSISACQFHDKVFIFATHAGFLHFTEPDFTTIRTFKCHRSSITSVYTDGELFASSSIDGTVVIGSVRDGSDLLACDFKRPVHAVVLDEKYKTTKTFVSGGMAGEVILSQRNWLGNRVDVTIEKSHGPIVGIYTVDDVLFWMNDAGITFYSISSKMKLLQVPFPRDEQGTRPDLYWPSVHFPETDRIIVAWAKHIWTFKISLTKFSTHGHHLGSILSSAASSLRATPDKKVEQDHYLYLSLTLAGAVAFRNDQLLCLEVATSEGSKDNMNCPQLRVIDMLTGEEVHGDEVVFKNYQNLNVNDYHLGKHIGKISTEYFMISSSDAISAHELSLRERFEWFIDNGRDYDAWRTGLFAVGQKERLDAGVRHIESLITAKEWEEAASAITEIFTNVNLQEEDAEFTQSVLDKWQKFIIIMIENDRVGDIAPLIPTEPPLYCDVYDFVLKKYLESNQLPMFSHYSHRWPRELWNSAKFQSTLEELIEHNDENNFDYRKELVFLLLTEQMEVKAVPHLIVMKDPRALDIIISHKVLPMFSSQLLEIVLLPYSDTIESLLSLSLEDAQMIFKKSIELLVRGTHMVDVSFIVATLSESPALRILLFLFLNKASKVEPVLIAPYEDDMVKLYFQFDHQHLLDFLKAKNNYDIDKAINICAADDKCFDELIYLWGRVGETKKALSLIIDRQNNPKLAAQFVENSGDPELWEYFVSYSMNKPAFIRELLDMRTAMGNGHAGIIRRIPSNLEIDDLQLALESVTRENFLNINVSAGVFKIIDDETTQFAHEFLRLREVGKCFEVENA
ncbi:LADA_0A04258g1_1 [Lachancea dasiensis]|uniref:Vacuolar protein sorting-associated protein 41 n=1 Tax=Lachancea dasiensis TaxID=1072105 RepID=A0A1G4INU9_9SACH|nr:LADA_0A04258g1_1 [Lachancea dasiensis]